MLITQIGLGVRTAMGHLSAGVRQLPYSRVPAARVAPCPYGCMRAWCDYVIEQAAAKRPKGSELPDKVARYLWDTGYHYGEWLIPSQNKDGLDLKNLKAIMALRGQAGRHHHVGELLWL